MCPKIKSEWMLSVLLFFQLGITVSYCLDLRIQHEFYFIWFLILSLSCCLIRNKFFRRKLIVFYIIVFCFIIRINLLIPDKNISNYNLNYINTKKEYYVKVLVNIEKERFKEQKFVSAVIIDLKPYEKNLIGRKVFIKNFNSKYHQKVLSKIELVGIFENLGISKKLIFHNSKKIDYIEKDISNSKEFSFIDYINNSKSLAFGWAMFTGYKKLMSSDDLWKCAQTGTMHLFAVSGLHIGFLYLLLSIFLFPIKSNRLLIFIIKFGLCFGYLLWVGTPDSGIRALLMIMFYELHKFVRSRKKFSGVFFLASILFLFLDPTSIFSIGTQLSFTVVMFILFILSDIKKSPNKFTNFLSFSFFISLSSACGSSLLVFDYFGFFAFLSIIANILISPFIFLFFAFNTILFTIFLVFDRFLFLSIHEFFYGFIFSIINFCSYLSNFLPNFSGKIIEIHDGWHLFVFFIMLFSFCFKLSWKSRFIALIFYYISFWVFAFTFAL